MESKYVIRNQNNLYLCRGDMEWDTGKDVTKIVSFNHYDEALNTLIEKSAKDIELRGSVLEVDCDEKGRPVVEVLVDSVEGPTEEPASENQDDESLTQNDTEMTSS